MRSIVCQMMTSLNGRLDDPIAWTTELGDDQYRDIDSAYSTFDTIIVGRVSYEEMAAYWPTALNDESASEPHRNMARRMDRYRKIVVTGSDGFVPQWTNCEAFVARNDEDLAGLAARLKDEAGADIHLSGGARLAQSFARLDLPDRYRLYVNPTVSEGAALFAKVAGRRDLRLAETRRFANGVTLLDYLRPDEPTQAKAPESFNDLIA